MLWILANMYGEELDALITLVRVCGGALQEAGGLYPETKASAVSSPHFQKGTT